MELSAAVKKGIKAGGPWVGIVFHLFISEKRLFVSKSQGEKQESAQHKKEHKRQRENQ